MPEIKVPVGEGPLPSMESPPPAAAPARSEPDPRARLHELARELMRSRNRQMLLEYLRLRRAFR